LKPRSGGVSSFWPAGYARFVQRLELAWREQTAQVSGPAPRWLDFVIDGKSLQDQRNRGVSPLGWGLDEEHAANRLLGIEPPDLEDRTAVLVCSYCGDIGCGGLTVRITRRRGLVWWRDFASSYFDGHPPLDCWVHEWTGQPDVCFDAEQYDALIGARRFAAAPGSSAR
jgi:hypothetical protein